jgi:nitrile hydratase beta subunit
MNNIHDMGGMEGFGKIKREENQSLFKHRWEELVFAASRLVKVGNIDEKRYTRETLSPARYLSYSYYGLRLYTMEKMYVKYGLMTEEELKNPEGRLSKIDGYQSVKAEKVESLFQNGRTSKAHVNVPAKFKVGDLVVVTNKHPRGHTRHPRYVRGRRGQVNRDHGVFHLPDRAAHGLEPKPQHCYSVQFTAVELWGSRSNPNDLVFLDLFDDYLEAF